MIGPNNDRFPQEMLPILLQAKDHPEEFTTGNAIPSLGGCQGLTSVAYDM